MDKAELMIDLAGAIELATGYVSPDRIWGIAAVILDEAVAVGKRDSVTLRPPSAWTA